MGNTIEKYNKKLLERIHILRGEKVIMDYDLAELYGVETKRLKEQVRRNLMRFPNDFMFVLNDREFDSLRSQFATANVYVTRFLPMAFTEQGIAMLSSVLNSELAIAVNIQIIRLFTHMRKTMLENKDIMIKMEEIEKQLLKHNGKMQNFELEIQLVFKTLKQLVETKKPDRNKIGFEVKV